MKISNQKTGALKVQILYVILALLVFSFLLIMAFRFIFQIKHLHIISLFFILLTFYAIIKSLGKPFFFYDSDGETLNIYNKRFSFIPDSTKVANKAEFPKSKLQSYKIISLLLYKRLELYLHSKKSTNHTAKLKYDISFLSSDEIKNLKISLNKIIKENGQNPIPPNE